MSPRVRLLVALASTGLIGYVAVGSLLGWGIGSLSILAARRTPWGYGPKGQTIASVLLIAVAFGLIFIYAAFTNFNYYINAAIEFAKSRPGILMISGGIFLFLGKFFEKNELPFRFLWNICDFFFAFFCRIRYPCFFL